MIFEKKGYITYTTKNNPNKPITLPVDSFNYYGNVQYIDICSDAKGSHPKCFAYNRSTERWLVPGRADKWGERKWKEFEGKVIDFEFKYNLKKEVEE